MNDQPLQLGVIGGAAADERHELLAFETGREVAQRGCVLLCGGGGGVMEAAARGARSAGGLTVGILPGASARMHPPNPHIELCIYTGMGQARNLVLVLSSAAVIGIGGGWGTLTEIGHALKHEIPVVLLESWELERPDRLPEPLLLRADSPLEAVELAIQSSRRQESR